MSNKTAKAEAFVVWAELGQAIQQVEVQLEHLKQLRLKARRVYEGIKDE